jgi:hypothetical protein
MSSTDKIPRALTSTLTTAWTDDFWAIPDHQPVKLPKFCTAEELSQDLKNNHGLEISPGRLEELGAAGYLPSYECEGHPMLFVPSKAKAWIGEHLIAGREARPFPAQLAVYDRDWCSASAAIPQELALIGGELREIPVAPFRWETGVYFLVRDGRVVYVGQSVRPLGRLVDHFSGASKRFDRIFLLPVPLEHLNSLESAFIRALRPEYNGCQNKRYAGPAQPYHVNLDAWFGGRRAEEIERRNGVSYGVPIQGDQDQGV